MICESIIGRYPSVGDVFEVKVIVPWGEECGVVPGRYNFPLGLGDVEPFFPRMNAWVGFVSTLLCEQ